jgi:hypothetical protein
LLTTHLQSEWPQSHLLAPALLLLLLLLALLLLLLQRFLTIPPT